MTPDAVAALVDAVDRVLDDMGVSRTSCCLATKAQLRAAFEPFRAHAEDQPMLLDAAEAILRSAGLLP